MFKNGFWVFKFTFLVISIAGNESNFTIKESMVMFPKNSTKRSKIVNDIDGDGDKDSDENRIGIKCYVKMVLSYKD